MAKFVRTVLGDIKPELLGVTYLHEHLIIDSEIVAKQFAHIYLPSIEDAAAEVALCKRVGVNAFVDCMPSGSGRDIDKLARISASVGVHIIATTGLHRARYYDSSDPLESMSAQQLADVFSGEILLGAEGTKYRTGVIKVVTSGSEDSDREKRLFEAAALTYHHTGAPILTHCENGDGALEQIELLQSLEVPLTSVILSHTDKKPDAGYHREILSSGVYVEYDQSLRQTNDFEPMSAKLTAQMVAEGFVDQIMLGTDGARRSLWQVLGGSPGLSWLYAGWSIKLGKLGLTSYHLNKIFRENPAKALAFDEIR